MNEQFGDWYREADLQPTHDTLANRWAGVEKVTEKITPGGLIELGRLFHGLAESGPTITSLKDALFEADNAFSTKNVLEVRVLAGVCLIEVAENHSEDNSHIAAYAMVCPALMGRRDGAFVPSIVKRANELLDKASGDLRRHAPSPATTISKIDEELTKIEAAEAANSFQQGGPPVRDGLKKLRTGLAAVSSSVTRLARTQSLFREDSDILWWMTGLYSRDLDQPFSQVGLPSAAILLGKELADLIQCQPGPVAAKAVLGRGLEQIGGDSAKKVTMTVAINHLPSEWKERCFGEDGNRDVLSLCPVTSAIRHSVTIEKSWGSAAQALSGVSATSKLSGIELAYQMYRECMFRKLVP